MAWEQQRNLTRQQMQEKLVFPIKLDMLAVVGTGLLVGVLLAQVLQYYRTFKTDRPVWRCMVLFLTLLGVSYFAVTVANLWTKTIYAMTADFPHGSFTKLDLAHLYQAAFIGSTAESFFAYRCWKVSKNIVVRAVLAVFWAALVALWVVSVTFGTRHYLGVEDDTTVDIVRTVGVWVAFAATGYIASVLAFKLILRRDVTHRPTEDLLSKFAFLSLRTSAVLALLSLAGAISSSFWSNQRALAVRNFFLNLYAILSPLSVVYTLNNRLDTTSRPQTFADGSRYTGELNISLSEGRVEKEEPVQGHSGVGAPVSRPPMERSHTAISFASPVL